MVSSPTSLPVTVPVSNPTRTRGNTPLTIFPAADLRFWGNTDNVVLGTPPDITTLTDLTEFGRDPTQGSASARPHQLTIGGKQYADIGGGQRWDVTAGVDFLATGTQTLSAWFAGRIDIDGERVAFDLSNLTTADTGMSFRISSGVLEARVVTTTGVIILNTGAYTPGPLSVFEVCFNATDFRINVDGIELATVGETGTMANDCDTLTIGRDAAGAGSFNGAIRELAIVAGAVASTDLQRAQMLAYMTGRL